ncbi:MAG: glycosyltransferase family 2 protein [candidate division Zixibacteria bacterium]|nr:glycosyltransferase family 2 protein [candidate division Zixibacteria bacterium]
MRNTNGNIKVSVMVPAYNEAENIAPLMEEFSRMFSRTGMNGEVILVDDGSTDGTSLKAKECQEKYRFLRVMTHRRNQGLTQALMTGFSRARGEIFVFWPADLQYLPQDIPKLIEKIDNGYDVVCGWKQGSYGLKRLVSFTYNLLSRTIFRIKVHDLNSVKAFRREVADEVPLRKDWHRYMVVMAAEKGYKIGEVKVNLYPRRFGQSKFGVWRVPIGFLDLLSVKFQLSFMKKPLLLFGSLGLVLIFLGILTGGVAVYLRIAKSEGLRPLLYLVILLVLSGLSFFVLGFLAEAIVSVKDEMRTLIRQISTKHGPRFNHHPKFDRKRSFPNKGEKPGEQKREGT